MCRRKALAHGSSRTRSDHMADPQAAPGDSPKWEERVLELGTGFNDAETTVLLDGRAVRPPRKLTTNYSVGLADVVPIAAPQSGGPVVLEVRVGARSTSVTLSPETPGRLRVDVEPDGTLRLGSAPEGPIY
jgi:hypothetical protein